MPHLLSLVVLALAVSLDGFGVGAMYGLRRIRIPIFSVVIIALLSGLVFYLSMLLGGLVSGLFSEVLAKMVGAVILIAIGCWAVHQMLTQAKREKDDQNQAEAEAWSSAADGDREKAVLSIELKRLGLVIQILKTPSAADLDRSGTISPMEAAWLGIALSLDAFGAGIGAAFIGFAPILTAIAITVSCGTFIYCGLRVGYMYSNVEWIKRLSILPGCILILMGVMKLF